MSRIKPRQLLKYGAVFFAALAVAYAVRAWEHAVNDVMIIYRGAPAGLLYAEIRDDDGQRIRRTEFGAKADRRHEIQLPRGRFDVRMTVDGKTSDTAFEVAGDGTIELKWR